MLKLTLTQLRARSYASWKAAGPTVIRVSSLVVDGIYTEAMKGYDEIPRRGGEPEVGGILIGRRGENEIIVEDFEPVLCEHRFGPSFRLSDSDRVDWRETLQRIRQGKELAIVGWYRSDTGRNVVLREDDRELLETELQPDGDVILFMKASRSHPHQATLFLRDQGQLGAALPGTHVTFDRPHSALPPPSAWEDSASFDSGHDRTCRVEVAPAASVEQQETQSCCAGRTAFRESEPEGCVPTPRVEGESERPRLMEPASEHQAAARPVLGEAEPACLAVPPVVVTEASEPRRQPAGRPARTRLLAEPPPDQPKSRKWSFVVVLFAAVGGAVGYYAVRLRPATTGSTPPAQLAPAPAGTSPLAPAPQPAHASPVEPVETEAGVQPPNPSENEPVAVNADTDRLVRLFLHQWAAAEKSPNAGEVGDFYAPQLSWYFRERGVTRAGVLAARAEDEARYGRMIVSDIRDIHVNQLDSGHTVATFRKHWQTAGPRVLMGEEQEQLTLIREQGKWQIGAEQRTKLYWVQKEHYAPHRSK